MNVLNKRGIHVRNQSVLLRGVNDDHATMITLIRRLAYLNIEPYYVFLCDLVLGIDDLRTSLEVAIQLEKQIRGATAGFNTPTFVCDTPGGGGKQLIHAFEFYSRKSGIAVYTAPSVKPNQFFLHYDPLHSLSDAYRQRWHDVHERQNMIKTALQAAKRGVFRD